MTPNPERQAPLAGEAPDAGMVWIPGGTFRMGSENFYPEERPIHKKMERASLHSTLYVECRPDPLYFFSLPVKNKGELPIIPVYERAAEVRAIKTSNQ